MKDIERTSKGQLRVCIAGALGRMGSMVAREVGPPFVIGGAIESAKHPRLGMTLKEAAVADSDIVVFDVLASRQHATLVQTPLGTEIRDRSINGTFVNGIRVGSAILTEGDVVTSMRGSRTASAAASARVMPTESRSPHRPVELGTS